MILKLENFDTTYCINNEYYLPSLSFHVRVKYKYMYMSQQVYVGLVNEILKLKACMLRNNCCEMPLFKQ